MAAVTIRHSFRTALPSYDPDRSGDAHLSGTTTLQTDPPRFCVLISHEAWVLSGLQSVDRVGRELDTEYTSLRENAMCHQNESDVVRGAAIYLLHPVNQALSALLAGSIRCLSEKGENTVRADIVFQRYRGNRWRYMAVVEFKSRGVIVGHEFRQAARTITRTSPVSEHVRLAVRAGGTFFGDDSKTLMKQASAYAIQYATQYVAFFNWDYLILIRFVQFDPRGKLRDRIINGVGDYCELSMIKYDRGSHLMRAALLGFLTEAYQQTPR
ncbi:hypothetical protein F4680DRAFT_467410 [Xylaria scruposa]|nr:hypothetical protein F4680DRAFT_467410 [Xylaria scruposa]